MFGLGTTTDSAAVPGVEEHAHTLSSAEDAEFLAERLARLGSGTVVVAGSGLTGVESAAEIAEQQAVAASPGSRGTGDRLVRHPRPGGLP
ncbi:hypothetical protein [Streptomyces nigra]|uniref:hypothetical protein n=1 Tax=Streptomyces nigra TaxID=1827580 RepID=UPI0036323D29